LDAYLVTEENRVDARPHMEALVDSMYLESENGKAIQELVSTKSSD